MCHLITVRILTVFKTVLCTSFAFDTWAGHEFGFRLILRVLVVSGTLDHLVLVTGLAVVLGIRVIKSRLFVAFGRHPV